MIHARTTEILADILARIRNHDPAKLDDLLPWNWTARLPAAAKAA